MNDVYELWHTETRNMMEDFSSEADALAAVRQMEDAFGPSYVDAVLLIAGPQDGDAPMHTVAAGAELVALARERIATIAHGDD